MENPRNTDIEPSTGGNIQDLQKPKRPRIAGELTPPLIEDSELKEAWDRVHGIVESTSIEEE
jgi:hypothetical protein